VDRTCGSDESVALRARYGEHLPQRVVAGAALIAGAAALQVAQRAGAAVDGLVDGAVGDAAADTDDHLLRLSLSIMEDIPGVKGAG
jgi:hypothetical protein